MPRNSRSIRIEGDIAYVPLTKGYEAIIDAADVHLVDGATWTALVSYRRDGSIRTIYSYRNIYARGGKAKICLMHRLIMGDPDLMQIDHSDGNGLNCRRANMRAATGTQNNCNQRKSTANTSGYKGVFWDKQTDRWRSEIVIHGKRHSLGRHSCVTAAAVAYAKASLSLHGEFGRVA